MSRVHALGLAVVVAIASPLAAARPQQEQQPVFRAGTDFIAVDVSVQQRGRPVENLTTKDFELRDKGVVQTIADFTREAQPIDVTLIVDVSGSLAGELLESLHRAVNGIGRSLRPTDRARLISFNQRVRDLGDFPGGRLPDAASAFGTPGGETALFDAMALALIRPTDLDHRQMAIVFTDGRDTLSYLQEADVTIAVTRANTALFVVAVTEGTKQRPQPSPHEKLFRSLADATGGQAVILQSDEDLGPSFLHALEDFRTSYVLRYVKTGGVEPGWHELAVRVTRPGQYDVRARQGYFVTR